MNDTQIFQILGIAFFAMGLGMFINPKFIKNITRDLENSTMDMMMGGLVSLTVGYFLIIFHNIWTSGWTLLITIVGWLALFKGLGFIIFPVQIMQFYKKIFKNVPHSFLSFLILFLGLVCLYLGYFA